MQTFQIIESTKALLEQYVQLNSTAKPHRHTDAIEEGKIEEELEEEWEDIDSLVLSRNSSIGNITDTDSEEDENPQQSATTQMLPEQRR